MKASVILNKVSNKLNDSGNIRWPIPTLILFLNSGQRKVAELRPDQDTELRTVQLVAGVEQAIPVDAIANLGMTRNMGSNGTTPGSVIEQVDRATKDAFEPDWMKAAAGTAVIEYVTVPHSRRKYLVSPPVHATTPVYAEIEVSVYPTDCVDQNSDISIPDEYENTLADWVLSEAMEIDTETARKAEAMQVKSRFYSSFGMKLQVDGSISPKSGDNQK